MTKKTPIKGLSEPFADVIPQNSSDYLDKEISQTENVLAMKQNELAECNFHIERLQMKLTHLNELKGKL